MKRKLSLFILSVLTIGYVALKYQGSDDRVHAHQVIEDEVDSAMSSSRHVSEIPL